VLPYNAISAEKRKDPGEFLTNLDPENSKVTDLSRSGILVATEGGVCGRGNFVPLVKGRNKKII
jgi:hypothetical protein